MAAASFQSATVAELHRMFSNLDSAVIESVLAANNYKVDAAIDHLLTMSIDTENQNNIQQAIPTIPLRQLPAVPNLYEDDPPPYPGHHAILSDYTTTTTSSLSQSSPSNSPVSNNYNNDLNNSYRSNDYCQRDLQIRKWKTSYDQCRACYIGDLPNDFLRLTNSLNSEMAIQSKSDFSGNSGRSSRCVENNVMEELIRNEEFLNELRYNKEFITALHSDQSVQSIPSSQKTRSFNYLSTKPMPLPDAPTVETLKTPKIRAKMLQNALTQIEQGQTIKTTMVPEESITQNDSYSYGKDNRERIPLPPAPFVSEFERFPVETNEEFISRLKHMGKNSIEKFNQLARRFSSRKDMITINTGKYSKQSTLDI